jgi:DnaK suppressor protein
MTIKVTAKKDYKTIVLPNKYVPKKSEEYMSAEQKAFFYQMLMSQKSEIEKEMLELTDDVNLGQKLDSVGAMDEGDAATLSVDADLSIKMRERNLMALGKIDRALQRMEDETYGYSVISGDEIGLKRLMVYPYATTTIEEKEESEK